MNTGSVQHTTLANYMVNISIMFIVSNTLHGTYVTRIKVGNTCCYTSKSPGYGFLTWEFPTSGLCCGHAFCCEELGPNIFFWGYLEVYNFDWNLRLLSYLIIMLVSLFFLQEEEEGRQFKTEVLKTWICETGWIGDWWCCGWQRGGWEMLLYFGFYEVKASE